MSAPPTTRPQQPPPGPPAHETPADGRARGPRPSVGEQYRDVRRTLLAWVAACLGVLPLCELFTDRGWLIDVWLAMFVVVLPGLLLRGRRRPSAWHVWIGILLLVPWLTVNFVRAHAEFGFLPLGPTWHDVGRLMSSLHETTSEGVAPVHSTVASTLALCALLGLVAALVDLLAVVGRRGALAGVPLLVIYTVAGAVPRHPVNWLWFVFAATGFLILLALDSSDDLQRWGHYIPRPSWSAVRGAGTASGPRIAVIAILIAVLVPVVMPSDSRNFVANLFHGGSDAEPGFGANLGGTGGISPFARLKGELKKSKPVDLFTVQVARGTRVSPYNLRTNVLSEFMPSGWRTGKQQGRTEQIGDSLFRASPGTAQQPVTDRFEAEIDVAGLRSNPPVFGNPSSVDGLPSDTRWNEQDQLLVGHVVTRGDQYVVDVDQPAPTAALLARATGSNPALKPWLALPTIRPYVRNLLTQIIKGASTPYAKALAINDFFTKPANGFVYSLTTGGGDSGDDLSDFLQTRTGYCQQYAAAMGVLLRLAGVPARVVLGYTHPDPGPTGSFTVTTNDAHAWVEAYFDGVGWVPFDPTPVSDQPGAARETVPWAPPAVDGPSDSTSTSSTPDLPRNTGNNSASDSAGAGVSGASTASGHRSSGLSTVLLVVLIAVVVLILVALTPAFVRWRRRRRRLARVRHGDTDALWAELSDTATDLGYVWSRSRSPRQVAHWLDGPSGEAAGSLRTLTSAVERARYSPDDAGVPGAELARELTRVRRALSGGRSLRTRILTVLLPPSLGRGSGGPGRFRRSRRH